MWWEVGHLLCNAWPSVQLGTQVARDLFVDDVNGSSGEPEPPTILQCLLQTFASLLGKAEIGGPAPRLHVIAQMGAVKEI